MTLLCVLTLCGCSERKSSLTEPSPPAPTGPPQTIPSTPDKPAVVSIDIPARMATLSFRAVAHSSRYVIEIGTSPGASNAAMLTTEEGAPAGAMFTRTVTDLPSGFLYARAKAQNQAGTSGPSAELRFLLQDLKYLTETLFLQSGPYGGDAQSGHDVVRGFRAGTHVRIRVSTSVTSEQRRGIESMVSQLGETGAPLTATVETMSGNVAFCVRNEIHVVSDDRCGPMASCITACSPATLTLPGTQRQCS